MTSQPTIVCRYNGMDKYGNPRPPDRRLKDEEEWCRRRVTCNRPLDPQRDDLGLYELEERRSLNVALLKQWNTWLRSPYCQCTYSSGHPPTTGSCRFCIRPMNPESVNDLTTLGGIDVKEFERIRRLRAGPTWLVVYENVVRAAELALKLLIKATGPAPEGQTPPFGKHNLRELWKKIPACAKAQVCMEIYANSDEGRNPHVITSIGEPITEPLPLSEQPVFDKFGEEFDSIRYTWDKLSTLGTDKVNELAQKWPDPINLYYLYLGTGAVLSVLQRRPWDTEAKYTRWDRRVQLLLGLDESAYHSDWPRTYISE